MAGYDRRTEGVVHSVMFNSSDGVLMDIFCHQPNPKIKAKNTMIVANSDPAINLIFVGEYHCTMRILLFVFTLHHSGFEVKYPQCILA